MLSTPGNNSTNGSTVNIENNDYPAASNNTADNLLCSVETSCNSTILVTAVDVRYTYTDGVCDQRLHIIDEYGAVNAYTQCEDLPYTEYVIYESTSNFIQINANPEDFIYWIKFECKFNYDGMYLPSYTDKSQSWRVYLLDQIWVCMMACTCLRIQIRVYSETCVREPPLRLTLNSGWCEKRCLSYKGTCHVILLAKLHGMCLYKTATFPQQPLKSISKVALLHRFHCIWWIKFECKFMYDGIYLPSHTDKSQFWRFYLLNQIWM